MINNINFKLFNKNLSKDEVFAHILQLIDIYKCAIGQEEVTVKLTRDCNIELFRSDQLNMVVKSANQMVVDLYESKPWLVEDVDCLLVGLAKLIEVSALEDRSLFPEFYFINQSTAGNDALWDELSTDRNIIIGAEYNAQSIINAYIIFKSFDNNSANIELWQHFKNKHGVNDAIIEYLLCLKQSAKLNSYSN